MISVYSLFLGNSMTLLNLIGKKLKHMAVHINAHGLFLLSLVFFKIYVLKNV
jgi:hypothetical protein